MSVLLKLVDAWKTYDLGEVQVNAVQGVSLEIRKGELVSIIGPSGSGKSTCMYLMGCLERASKGKVIFEGQDVSNLGDNHLSAIRRKRIGFIFQSYNLIPNLTAAENVQLPMIFSGLASSVREARAIELLKLVGLSHRLNHTPNEMSGGEQQRVAVARALANDPDVIMGDEPTGNLDSKTGKEILDLLKELNKRGKTLIIVTHDPQVARAARRIIKMKDGKIWKGS